MTRLAHMLAAAAAFFGLGPAPVPAGNRPTGPTGAPQPRRYVPKPSKVYARRAPALPVVLMYPGPGQRRAGMSAETEARVRAAQRAQALAATNPRTRRMYASAAAPSAIPSVGGAL